MSVKDCIVKVKTQLGKELSREEENELAEKLAAMLEKARGPGEARSFVNSVDIDTQLTKAIQEHVEQAKVASLYEARNSALKLRAEIKKYNEIKKNWLGDEIEGLQATLESNSYNIEGSRNSVYLSKKAAGEMAVGSYLSDLSENNVYAMAKTDKFDKDLWACASELSMTRPDMKKIEAYPPEVRKLAEIFVKHKRKAILDYNNAGGGIKDLEGHVLIQKHEKDGLKRFAGNDPKLTEKDHQKAWVNYMKERLSKTKALTEVPSGKIDAYLNEKYIDFVTGNHISELDLANSESAFKDPGNIAKKYGLKREFVFNDEAVDGFDYYNRTKVDGTTLSGRMIMQIKSMAERTALLKELGPNPKETFDNVIKRLAVDAKKRGDTKALETLGNEGNINMLNKAFKHSTGIGKREIEPVSSSGKIALKFAKNFRALQSAKDLAMAAFSGVVDLKNAASVITQYSDRGIIPYWHNLGKVGLNFLSNIKSLPKSEQIKMIRAWGIMTDALMPGIDGSPIGKQGRTQRMLDGLNKLNGIQFVSDNEKIAALRIFHADLADDLKTPFKDLSKGRKSWIKQYGMSEADWNVLSKSKLTDFGYHKSLDVDEIAQTDLKQFENHPEFKERIKALESIENNSERYEKNKEKILSELRDSLTRKIAKSNSDIGSRAVTEGNSKTERLMDFGDSAGSKEVASNMLMYKKFAVTQSINSLGSHIYGDSDTVHKSITESIHSFFNPKKLAAVAGTTFAAGMVLGHLRNGFIDLLSGREPIWFPEDEEQLKYAATRALTASAGLGILGDIAFTDAKGSAELIAQFSGGPTAQRAAEAVLAGKNLISDAYDGLDEEEFQNAGNRVFKSVLKNTPVLGQMAGHPATKILTNYALVYPIQEYLNPGYLEKMENRLERDKNQKYIYPPSEYALGQ